MYKKNLYLDLWYKISICPSRINKAQNPQGKIGIPQNYISFSFHIEWNVIVATVFLSILNQNKFHLVKNRQENCQFSIQFERKWKYIFLYIHGDIFSRFGNINLRSRKIPPIIIINKPSNMATAIQALAVFHPIWQQLYKL